MLIVNPKISPKEIVHSRDNWVVMIDYSGSMIGEQGIACTGETIVGQDIFDEARTALLNLIPKYLESGSLYEFYTFNEKPSKIVSGTIDSKGNLSDLIHQLKFLNRPPSSGTTSLYKALEVGSIRAKELSLKNDLPTRLLLITDGFNSPDTCLPLEQNVNLGVTYILEKKDYIRLYPLGYMSIPSNNPLSRHCFFKISSSKLPYFTIAFRAVFVLLVFSLIWHSIFLFFVNVAIKDRNNLNIISVPIVWVFNQYLDVMGANSTNFKGKAWKYGVVLLLHSIPASIFAYYSFCYLLHPLVLFNGSILGLTILAKIRRY